MLSLFRSRLIEHGLEQTTLELVLERLCGLGLLKAGGRQRTDSTHVLAAVRTLNRMEFVGETLRAALEALAVAAPAWCPAWSRPSGPSATGRAWTTTASPGAKRSVNSGLSRSG